MTFEQMQAHWAEHDRKLEWLVQVNRELLRERAARPLRTRLQKLTLFAAAEAALYFVALLLTGSFLYEHWGAARFAVPALALHAWLVAACAACVYELVLASRIDYGRPVREAQRSLAELRAFRVRSMQWALLTGQVVWWIPFVIVALKGVAGIDAYAIIPTSFMAAQIGVGVVAIPALLWAARRIAATPAAAGLVHWLAQQIAGAELTEAQRLLEELAEFERQPAG